MADRKQKGVSPWKPLIGIPIILVIDVVLFIIAAMVDSTTASGGTQGHPAPVFTILAVIVIVGITFVVFIVSIIRTIGNLIRNSK